MPNIWSKYFSGNKSILILKALLNRSNIWSNITKMPCWMTCWIGLTEGKNSKKRKYHVGWRKIVLDENLIGSKFFIQHFLAHSTQFSCWIGFSPCFIQPFIPMPLFLFVNSTKLKRSAIKKSHTSMSLNISGEDFDHLSKFQ